MPPPFLSFSGCRNELLLIVGGLSFPVSFCSGFCSRRHRDDPVLALFVVKTFNAQLQVVLVDVELGLFADR